MPYGRGDGRVFAGAGVPNSRGSGYHPSPKMSGSNLPSEITDHIIELLRSEHKTLRTCCLVSKSWVPRARRHLFSEIAFNSVEDLSAWEKTFPDPVDSPAHHIRSLSIGCPSSNLESMAKGSGWSQALSNAVQLEVQGGTKEWIFWFLPQQLICFFYLIVGMMFWSPTDFINHVCSLPLLEDVGIFGYALVNDEDESISFQPSTSPPLSGTLALNSIHGVAPAIHQLLQIPNGVYFRKLTCSCNFQEVDLRCIMAVVEACSDTLECIDLYISKYGAFHPIGFPYGVLTHFHLPQIR